MSHLSGWVKERKRESEGEEGLKSNHRREMSYLHISKIHHRTTIKGLVNTVLHTNRNYRWFLEFMCNFKRKIKVILERRETYQSHL